LNGLFHISQLSSFAILYMALSYLYSSTETDDWCKTFFNFLKKLKILTSNFLINKLIFIYKRLFLQGYKCWIHLTWFCCFVVPIKTFQKSPSPCFSESRKCGIICYPWGWKPDVIIITIKNKFLLYVNITIMYLKRLLIELLTNVF